MQFFSVDIPLKYLPRILILATIDPKYLKSKKNLISCV